jgi:O-antigen/teichoic acid export membrane protein
MVGRTAVPVSQVLLAGSGYLVLVLGGRNLPAAGFAVLSSFYLVANTLGRGTFAATELEMTRSVAAARASGDDVAATVAAGVRGALALLGLALLVTGLAAPLLVPALGGAWALALLAAASVTLAASYVVRGPFAAAGRYGRYSATFLVEALVATGGAVALVVQGVSDVLAWVAVLAVAPAAGALAGVLARSTAVGPRRILSLLRDRSRPAGLTALLWSALLFVASQGVWNLGPVVVAARWNDQPAAVAGFAATAVLLRAPVMVFPAVQALLLPALVRGERRPGLDGRVPVRVLAVGVGALVVAFIAGAVLLAPGVARVVFGAPEVPGPVVLAALAVSIVLGAAAQFLQALLLARGRHRAVALAWSGGLVLLVAVAALPVSAGLAAAVGQLAATVVVALALVALLRRPGSPP